MTRTARRLGVTMIAAVAALAATGGAAQASVGLSPGGPYTTGDPVSVSGTAPTLTPAATHYAVAECNVTSASPAVWATRCNGATSPVVSPPRFRNLAALGLGGTFSTSITVEDTFADANFAGGPPPGTTTTCDSIGADPCAVVVSYYYFPVVPGPPSFLGAEKANLAF